MDASSFRSLLMPITRLHELSNLGFQRRDGGHDGFGLSDLEVSSTQLADRVRDVYSFLDGGLSFQMPRALKILDKSPNNIGWYRHT
jgi:hypothetical protein